MRFLLMAVMLMSLLPAAAHALDAAGVRKEIARHANAPASALDEQQFSRARELFSALLKLHGKPTAAVLDGWQALGYHAVLLDGGDTHFALLPSSPAVGAQGVFLFDTGVVRREAVQAPHLRDDTGTGELALRLFFSGKLFAAMTSTARRETVDLAHEPRSLFTAFAAALALQPDARLLQLHGFEREKRESAAGRIADSVISSGTRWPTGSALALRQCIDQGLGGLHRVYGVDINELGGTQNGSFAQFPVGHGGFLHIELAREFRERLLQNDADQQRFFRCLLP